MVGNVIRSPGLPPSWRLGGDDRRPVVRVAIVNLFAPPDLAPSGHLAASLAEHRAALGDRVTLISGTGSYVVGHPGSGPGGTGPGANGRRPPRYGSIRIWTPSLGKGSIGRRVADYVAFLLGATVRLAVMPRQDVVIALTSPPYILVAAAVHRWLHPGTRVLLWSHDLYPDAAEAYGTVRQGGTVSRACRALQRWLFRSVDHVIAVDPAMLTRVQASYATDGAPTGSMVPTWEPAALYPADPVTERWARYEASDLAGRFIVLHLGNLGYGHRIDTIAEVASRLSDCEVTFLFVGGGARYRELAEEVRRRGLRNVVLHGYVPKEVTPEVLAGADCALISLDDRSLGIMSPCKMNGSLAMGVPVVYAGPPGSTVDDTVRRFGCGFSIRHDDVDGVEAAIRVLHDDPARAAEMSRNARIAFEASHSDTSALPRFDAVLDHLQSGSASVIGSSGSSQPEPGAGASPC